MKAIFALLFSFLSIAALAQGSDKVYYNNIQTTQLYKPGDQTSFPMLTLNNTDALELHFDDLDGDVKNYYYAFQLCNADWTPSILSPFEYTTGFQNIRINNYRNSSVALTRYTHYQAVLPDRSSKPKRSGNYLLKVFLNGDTTRLAFTKRFVVVDNKTVVGAQIIQPFNADYFRTHQKLQIAVQTDNKLNAFSPQDLKLVVLQNNNWQSALYINQPTITRGNYYEYNDERITAMPGGKEWRWVDLRSYRLKSDRIQSFDTKGNKTGITVRGDASRNGQQYAFFRDLNGSYNIETLDNANPFWQGDYAYVQFSYFPPANRVIEGNDLYLFGALTRFALDTSAKMQFNADRGAYEKTLFLKQGFYNYTYVTQPQNKTGYPDASLTEGNYWGTENTYTVLLYFRPFGARADELIGFTTLSSVFQRAGF